MKPRMKKGIRAIIAILLVIWFASWRIKIRRWNVALPQAAITNEQAVAHMSGLQDITGTLLIFPGAFPQFSKAREQPTTRLQIENYEFTEPKIKEQMKSLLSRGVLVQLILENHMYQQTKDMYRPILNMFSWYKTFAITYDQRMRTEYVHSKVDILDNSFLIKTANLTHSSLFENREYMFLSSNPGVLKSLKTVFTKDRSGWTITLADLHPNLVVCNINCRGVIEHMLNEAKESIIIDTQYINDAAIIDILSKQQKKVKEMKLLVANIGTNDMVQSLLPDFTKKYTERYLHAKMILIDHKLLLLGSMNLSANSLDKNREIWILLTNPTIISQFTTQFTKDRMVKK
jgi:cardiolipin synthase A/B